MRISIHLSTVPDGGITRVNLVACDLDAPNTAPWSAEMRYDSGIYPPEWEDRVDSYVARILAQLEARVARDGLETVHEYDPPRASATPPL